MKFNEKFEFQNSDYEVEQIQKKKKINLTIKIPIANFFSESFHINFIEID